NSRCTTHLSSLSTYSSRHHRDLHSFPTRRSSDLEGRRLYGQTIPSEMPNKECFTYRRSVGVFGCLTACNFPVAVPAWYFVPALVDRKSTRLNSSHVKISYAVFCLKKKKKR